MVFDEKMTVMQVRPHYSIVYQFKPQVKVEKTNVKSQKNFVTFIRDISGNWKDGDYFLKCSKGTFCYFTLNGRRVKLFKRSRAGRDYLCWEYFCETKK